MGRLVRSRDDQMLGGVCAGIAEQFEVDPTLVRVGFALITLLSSAFPGVLVYIVMWAVIPEGD
jgi:phage shock protein C